MLLSFLFLILSRGEGIKCSWELKLPWTKEHNVPKGHEPWSFQFWQGRALVIDDVIEKVEQGWKEEEERNIWRLWCYHCCCSCFFFLFFLQWRNGRAKERDTRGSKRLSPSGTGTVSEEEEAAGARLTFFAELALEESNQLWNTTIDEV